MRIKKSKNLLFLLIFLILINLIYSINGFGLSMVYNNKDKPLIMSLGETRDVDFTLLSSKFESDKRIRLDIIEGEEIASLNKNEFDLPSDGEERGIINIKIPESEEKSEILVRIIINDITYPDNSGNVGFSSSSEVSFKVKIFGNEKKLLEYKMNSYALLIFVLILATLILIVFIYLLLKRKKSHSKYCKSKSRKI